MPVVSSLPAWLIAYVKPACEQKQRAKQAITKLDLLIAAVS